MANFTNHALCGLYLSVESPRTEYGGGGVARCYVIHAVGRLALKTLLPEVDSRLASYSRVCVVRSLRRYNGVPGRSPLCRTSNGNTCICICRRQEQVLVHTTNYIINVIEENKDRAVFYKEAVGWKFHFILTIIIILLLYLLVHFSYPMRSCRSYTVLVLEST